MLLRIILTLTILGAVASSVALPSSAQQQPTQRVVINEVPKDLPISVRPLADKENKFKSFTSKRWVDAFQLEVTNTGTKPIYFIEFTLIPDIGEPEGGRRIGITVFYGRKQLAFPEEPSLPSDVPIMPKDKVVLGLKNIDPNAWYYFMANENWPDEKSKPAKVSLYFHLLSYGDGTGYEAETGSFSVKVRERPRP